MRNLILKTTLIITIISFSYSFSQEEKMVEKYSMVSITVQNRNDLTELQKTGFSLEGTKLKEQALEIILNESEIIKLKDSGFSYKIIIDDMSKYYEERNRRSLEEMKKLEKEMKERYNNGGFGFGSMGGYYTYDEVVVELDSMRMLYPNLITEKDSIGSTLEGRIIWAVKISDNPDINESEPEVFYNALTHAREPEGMMSVIYFMYYLLESYGSDPEVSYLVDNREFYFVPVINPDGYVYNETIEPIGGGMWRKNRKDNGNGCLGVDLNRNFGYMWGYNNIGSSPDPCSDLYRGTEGFSEFETQAIRDFCNNHDFIICNNYHSWWNVIFTPWEYVLNQTPDSMIFNTTISLATQLNGYGNGWYDPEIYEVNGGIVDWMYGEQTTKPRIFAYLTEVGNEDDGFWPIPERIFPISEENCYLNKVLAWGPGVIDNPPHIFEADVYPSTYIQFNDSVTVSAKELNPDNYSSDVTVFVLDSEDNIVDEFQLNKIDTTNYVGTHLIPQEENIYRVLLKDSGVQIPSNFYYSEESKFTTAGPIVVDSLLITYNPIPKTYKIYPFVRNAGQSFTVENLSLSMASDDSSITYIYGTVLIPSIAPGETVMSSGYYYTVRVDTNFSLPFKFNFNIKSNDYTFWKDTVSIVTSIKKDKYLPVSYKLYQNYPNPFNPLTTIKYQIPELSFITLRVYDVLGNEIETLLNKEQPQGVYEIEFDGSNLSSGVYLYKLETDSYTKTRKMILLR